MENKVRYSRNATKIFRENNNKIFRKVIKGPEKDALRRFNNSLVWESLKINIPQINSPKLFTYDSEMRILDYEMIENATSLEDDLYESNPRFNENVIKAVEMLATLHTAKINNTNIAKESELPRRERLLLALDKYEYASCTGAEIELFSLLHQDKKLVESAIESSTTVDYCLCHGDIRLDQFIYKKNEMWMIDFEELRIGNPMRDLAGVVGSIYFDCLINTFSKTTQDTSNEKEIENQFLERGERYILKAKPTIKNIINRYSEYIEINFSNLSKNIGWFLIERVMSRAKFSFRLLDTDKAILGIGREIIVSPEKLLDLFE
ncbi:phosphotransferase [Staphylococcus agnetis]|uniref:phosphotransferase n=1 Tax=Staphylococcus agnetis TaxID=985762 RepID=UPI001430A8BE|nr:phosphotransferase [Staphylococcus agnetis]NJH97159.1 phosphotransferase [Staphylococcus agnetis]